MKPPFQTPLLIRCCTYKNPFEESDVLTGTKVQKKLNFKKVFNESRIANLAFQINTHRKVHFVEPIHAQQDIEGLQTSSHDEVENSSEKGIKLEKKYYFANWIDIIYLFDLRLIESNLYLQALSNPHGSDLAQPVDSLNVLDRCRKIGPNDMVENSYFYCLGPISK